MLNYFWIAVGSALGGMARYWCSGVAARLLGETFPWGTLFVNIAGSFIIGFFATLTGPDGRILVGSTARLFVMIGFCVLRLASRGALGERWSGRARARRQDGKDDGYNRARDDASVPLCGVGGALAHADTTIHPRHICLDAAGPRRAHHLWRECQRWQARADQRLI